MTQLDNPYEQFLTAVERAGRKVERRRGGAMVQCTNPAHPETVPSVSVSPAGCGFGCVLIYCQPGCDTANVIAGVGWQYSDLFNPECTRHNNERKTRESRVPAIPRPRAEPKSDQPDCDHEYRLVAE